MSFIMSLRRSPKPGGLTAATCNVPRSLLTTSVARASPSTSEMISSGRPARATCSRIGSRSFMFEMFFSWIRMKGSSSLTSMRSVSVTKYGDW